MGSDSLSLLLQHPSSEHFGRPRRTDHLRSGVRDQPGQHGKAPPLLKIQKLAGEWGWSGDAPTDALVYTLEIMMMMMEEVEKKKKEEEIKKDKKEGRKGEGGSFQEKKAWEKTQFLVSIKRKLTSCSGVLRAPLLRVLIERVLHDEMSHVP
ncbi:hypothetical protein AAY473_029534 [Plecturocebus cupreus]